MNSVIVSMTFPPEMLAKIDRSRGEISRSRYIRKMLEKEMLKGKLTT